MSGDWVHLDVEEILHETPLALKLLLEDGEELWVPKSVVENADYYARGDKTCTVSITARFAESKGIEAS